MIRYFIYLDDPITAAVWSTWSNCLFLTTLLFCFAVDQFDYEPPRQQIHLSVLLQRKHVLVLVSNWSSGRNRFLHSTELLPSSGPPSVSTALRGYFSSSTVFWAVTGENDATSWFGSAMAFKKRDLQQQSEPILHLIFQIYKIVTVLPIKVLVWVDGCWTAMSRTRRSTGPPVQSPSPMPLLLDISLHLTGEMNEGWIVLDVCEELINCDSPAQMRLITGINDEDEEKEITKCWICSQVCCFRSSRETASWSEVCGAAQKSWLWGVL